VVDQGVCTLEQGGGGARQAHRLAMVSAGCPGALLGGRSVPRLACPTRLR
jgi:hypothetical protein